MAIISFPENLKQRQAIMVLDKQIINKVGNLGGESLAFLHDPNVLIVPYPVTEFSKRKSPILKDLVDKGLIELNQMLVLSDDDLVGKESIYLSLDQAILSFLDESVKLAHAYSRFFAVLGAKKVCFENSRNQENNSRVDVSINLDGIAAKVANIDIGFAREINGKLSELARIVENFYPVDKLMETRIQEAEKILLEEGLNTEVTCQATLKKFKDGTRLKSIIITLNGAYNKNSNINAFLNFGLKLSDEKSLARIKGTLDCVNLVMQVIDKKMEVIF